MKIHMDTKGGDASSIYINQEKKGYFRLACEFFYKKKIYHKLGYGINKNL